MIDGSEGVVSVLLRAAAELTKSGERDDILSSLLDGLARLVPYDTANVELRDETGIFRVHAGRGYERWGQEDAIRQVVVDPARTALIGEIVSRRESILVSDCRHDPRWQTMNGGEHVQSWIGVPLLIDGEVIGIYSVDKAEPGFFTEEHMRLVELLAPHASIAIERSGAEQALRESESRLVQILEDLPIGVFVVDAAGRPIYANPMSAEILGAEIVPTGSSGAPPGAIDAALVRALLGERVRIDDTEIALADRVVPIELTAAPVYGAPGRIAFAAVAFNDISERRAVERRLVQSQKLEAVGQLAGGVAHDFNNILTAISGYADLTLARDGNDARSTEYVTEIARAAQRAKVLTQRLLAFSRGQIVHRRTLDLSRVVTELEGLLRRLIGEHIELRIELGEGPMLISADVGQLEQVIVNLAVNARDSMPAGGVVTIRTTAIDLGDEEIAELLPDAILEPPSSGRYIALAVVDRGSGIDEGTMSRLFDPFFTTKPVGLGTGLGLATVFGIVQQGNGRIGVESDSGQGATFTVYLPAVDGTAADLEAPDGTAELARGTETILYAEDDYDVRGAVGEMLRDLGYTVLIAPSGAAALALSHEHRGEIHVLLTDMVMPGMSGEELAAQVVAERPEIAVLVVSGYLNDPLAESRLTGLGIASLPKPFTQAELAARLRSVIARS